MDKDDIEQVAESVAQKTATKIFAKLDVDISDEAQVRDLRDNLHFIDGMRRSGQRAGQIATGVAVTVITGAFLMAMWDGIAAAFGRALR